MAGRRYLVSLFLVVSCQQRGLESPPPDLLPPPDLALPPQPPDLARPLDLATAPPDLTPPPPMGPAPTFAAAKPLDVSAYPTDVHAADFNQDGRLDLAAVAANGQIVSVLRGNGDGTFAAAVHYALGLGMRPLCMDSGDLDGDGDRDIVVSEFHDGTSGSVSVLLNQGGGKLGAPVRYPIGPGPFGIAMADVNGDGRLDVAVAETNGRAVTLLRGAGNGALQMPLRLPLGQDVRPLVARDLDGDGRAEVIAASTEGNLLVLRDAGTSGLAVAATHAVGADVNYCRSIALGDVDGDGRTDVALPAGQGGQMFASPVIAVLRGRPGGLLQLAPEVPTKQFPHAVAIADFNRDGRADLAVTQWYGSDPPATSILVHQGVDGTSFVTAAPLAAPTYAANIIAPDLDGDGRPDLAYEDPQPQTGTIQVRLNTTP